MQIARIPRRAVVALALTLAACAGTVPAADAASCLMRGTPRADRLTGGWGADRICALAGGDLLFGGAGNDSLNGGSGNDRIAAVAATTA